MGTEEYWKQEKKRNDIRDGDVNLYFKLVEKDNKDIRSPKHPKALYADCLKGALYWDQWAKSDDLNINDMSMMICRDIGCELSYCQMTMRDPYERPFEDCEQQFKQFNSCIAQEQRRYQFNPEGRSMQEHIRYMLEKKKKEKYFDVFEKMSQTNEVEKEKEREYIIKSKL